MKSVSILKILFILLLFTVIGCSGNQKNMQGSESQQLLEDESDSEFPNARYAGEYLAKTEEGEFFGRVTIYCQVGDSISFRLQIGWSPVYGGMKIKNGKGVYKSMYSNCILEFAFANNSVTISEGEGGFDCDFRDNVHVNHTFIKEPEEIEALRQAVDLTAEGLRQMLDSARAQPGLTEKEILEIFKQKIVALGSEGASFGQVAAGSSAASPHAPTLDEVPTPDEMFVVDVGAIKEGYTGDITICFTLSGEFTEEQQTIYDIIYRSLEAAVEQMVAGNNHAKTESMAMDLIMKDLYDLGLVTDLDSPWQRSFWIQHGFGHHIGLDVHDVWYDYIRMVPNDVRVYLPNMVITIEPGLYFAEDALKSVPRRLANRVSEEEFMTFAKEIEPIYEKYKGIAVRLEEDILIKADGTNENLSKMILK